MPVYKFRNCLLNTTERSVIRDREFLELTSKTFDVLQYLIENAGNIVSKDELLGHVWGGNFVEESNLPVHISKLRRSLFESRGRRFIETVQGTGYRFVAPLFAVDDSMWGTAASKSYVGYGRELSLPDDGRTSIAVLPLQNEACDSEIEYLLDGLTDALINGLSSFPTIKVIARNTVFWYKNRPVHLSQIGETLGVSHLLTGRARISDDKIVLGVELTRAQDETHIWGRSFTKAASDVVGVQNEVVFTVLEQIARQSFRDSSVAANALTRRPESYRLYLKGRYYLEKHSALDMRRAIDYFERSVAEDPGNIHARVEIVECFRSLHAYGYISYVEFLEAIEPILAEISQDDYSVDAVQVLFCDLKMLEWKFEEAAKHCKTALSINANSLKGRLRYSDLLLQSRNFTDALEQLERVMIIDPLSTLIYKRIGRLFYVAGDFRNSKAYLNDALDLEPESYEALALRGAVHAAISDFKAALSDYESALSIQPHSEIFALMGVVYAQQGDLAGARRVLDTITTKSTGTPCSPMSIAHLYIAIGDVEKSISCLEQAYVQHDPDLRALNYDGRWDTIRSDSRFRSLTRRVGLPQLGKLKRPT